MNAPLPVIIITGFMGAGKTTVAAALARKLSCAMIDLDRLIRERCGRTPQEIIDEDGEKCFREIETEALHAALESRQARVIALGGGAWTIAGNRALINQHRALTVWLDAPFDLCWQRILSESISRPFGRDLESARVLYDKRREFYDQAQLHVEITEDKTSETVVAEIRDALSQNYSRT